MKILFATTNQDKLKEAQEILAQINIKLLSLNDFSQCKEIEVAETGQTFQDNALLKAKKYAQLTKVLTLAEDAGLVVDALDGKPGIKSARFGPNDQARNTKLLAMLGDEKNRTANYVSIMCLYNPADDKYRFFKGKIKGKIALKVTGLGGFGYDPLFIPHGYTKSFGELKSTIKNQISHRKKSLTKVLKYLNKL